MTAPLKLALGLTLLALPLVEIALLIKAGGAIGFWNVVGLVLLTAVAGILTIRAAGLSAISRLMSQMQSGSSPFGTLLDQFLSITAGVLLILPGLLGDCLGALLLAPAVRRLIVRSMGPLFTFDTKIDTPQTPGQAPGSRFSTRASATRHREDAHITIIEGEYHRMDDDERP